MTDDEPVLLTAISKQLTQTQHKVRGFKSEDELVDAVDQRELDARLPDTNAVSIGGYAAWT